jgi:hypothetical protein
MASADGSERLLSAHDFRDAQQHRDRNISAIKCFANNSKPGAMPEKSRIAEGCTQVSIERIDAACARSIFEPNGRVISTVALT